MTVPGTMSPLLCTNSEENALQIMSLAAYSSETNKAACFLTFSNYVSDAGQLLEILGWKDLNCQGNTQKKIIMVFKCLHGLALDYLALKFSQRNTSYNLRDSSNKVNVQLPHKNYFKSFFSCSGYYACLAPNMICSQHSFGLE